MHDGSIEFRTNVYTSPSDMSLPKFVILLELFLFLRCQFTHRISNWSGLRARRSFISSSSWANHMISGTFFRSMSLTRIIFTNYQSKPRIKWEFCVALMMNEESIEMTLIPMLQIAERARLIISVVLKISVGFFSILSSTVSFWILFTSLQNTIPLLQASNKSSFSTLIGSKPNCLQNSSSFKVSLMTHTKQTFSSSA